MASCPFAQTPNANIGDAAPPLTLGKYLVGQPIQQFHQGQVYVIVFWASWCAPFIPEIQHLSDLQRLYDGKATVLAVDVFEQDQSRAAALIEKMGPKVGFSVALDQVPPQSRHGLDGAMVKLWMQPFNETGIPIAFIVDQQGRIAWIGTPSQSAIDDPLRRIIDGSWDLAAFAQKFSSEQQRQQAVSDISAKVENAMQKSEWDNALKQADELTPYNKGAAAVTRYLIMLRKGDFKAAYEYAAELADGPFAGDASTLWSIAWLTVNPAGHWAQTDYELGLKTAKKACDLTYNKDPKMLDTLAWAYFENKDKQDAISTENQAINFADETQKPQLEANLKTFSSGDK